MRQVVDATGSPLLTQTFDPYGSLYAHVGEEVTRFGFIGVIRRSPPSHSTYRTFVLTTP